MPKPIAILIDVSKIDKARLFRSKDGKKLYAAFVAWPKKDGPDQFGNSHYLTQDRKRDEDVKMPILGDLKLPPKDFAAATRQAPPPRAPATSRPRPPADPDLDAQADDVPF